MKVTTSIVQFAKDGLIRETTNKFMPEKKRTKEIPTYEELEKMIGKDKMSFLSEMLTEPGDTSKDEDIDEQ